MWSRRPGVMLLGMLPALLAFALVVTVVVLLATQVTTIADWLTPFADGWGEFERDLLRGAASAAIVLGVIVLAFYTFTTLTLLVGDPFYELIWKRTEADLGAFAPTPLRFWRSAGEGLLLVLRAIGYGLTTFAIGLIPAVGQIAAPIIGAILGGHLIARELTQRPFEARGIPAAYRRGIRRGSRARELGFGIMTQLFFLIPGGAIIVMPAAVVGATRLARDMLERASAASTTDPPRDEGPAVADPSVGSVGETLAD